MNKAVEEELNTFKATAEDIIILFDNKSEFHPQYENFNISGMFVFTALAFNTELKVFQSLFLQTQHTHIIFNNLNIHRKQLADNRDKQVCKHLFID